MKTLKGSLYCVESLPEELFIALYNCDDDVTIIRNNNNLFTLGILTKNSEKEIVDSILKKVEDYYGKPLELIESYSAESTSVGSGANKPAYTTIFDWSGEARKIINPYYCWEVRGSSYPSSSAWLTYLLSVFNCIFMPKSINIIDRHGVAHLIESKRPAKTPRSIG